MRPREIAGAPVPPRPSKDGGGHGEKLIPRRCINNSRGGSAPPSAGGILAASDWNARHTRVRLLVSSSCEMRAARETTGISATISFSWHGSTSCLLSPLAPPPPRLS